MNSLESLIIGQAPGRRVHESGVPWDDPSGVRLREWLGINERDFYAQSSVLGENNKPTLTNTVRAWQEYRPSRIPLPHPSPRNNRWLKNNPWFDEKVVPYLKRRVQRLT
jgi:uracil-DNA glycosylase